MLMAVCLASSLSASPLLREGLRSQQSITAVSLGAEARPPHGACTSFPTYVQGGLDRATTWGPHCTPTAGRTWTQSWEVFI